MDNLDDAPDPEDLKERNREISDYYELLEEIGR